MEARKKEVFQSLVSGIPVAAHLVCPDTLQLPVRLC